MNIFSKIKLAFAVSVKSAEVVFEELYDKVTMAVDTGVHTADDFKNGNVSSDLKTAYVNCIELAKKFNVAEENFVRNVIY